MSKGKVYFCWNNKMTNQIRTSESGSLSKSASIPHVLSRKKRSTQIMVKELKKASNEFAPCDFLKAKSGLAFPKSKICIGYY